MLLQEHLVKDGLALDFLIEVMVTWKAEKGLQSLMTALKRGGLEGRLLEFLPSNKRGDDNFKSTFEDKGLGEVVKLHKAQVRCLCVLKLHFQVLMCIVKFRTFYACFCLHYCKTNGNAYSCVKYRLVIAQH